MGLVADMWPLQGLDLDAEALQVVQDVDHPALDTQDVDHPVPDVDHPARDTQGVVVHL